jgi:hypothetical protein
MIKRTLCDVRDKILLCENKEKTGRNSLQPRMARVFTTKNTYDYIATTMLNHYISTGYVAYVDKILGEKEDIANALEY